MQPLRFFSFLLLLSPLISWGQQKYIDILFLKNDAIRYGSLQRYQVDDHIVFLGRTSKETETIPLDKIERIVQFRLPPTSSPEKNIAVEDVVLLKNGSVFRGEILEYEKGGQLELNLYTGDKLLLEDAAIQQIIQESLNQPSKVTELFYIPEVGGSQAPYIQEDIAKLAINPNAFQELGLYHVIYLGLLNTQSEDDFRPGVNVNYNIGYLFNRWLGVGVGTGFDSYDMVDNEHLVPIYGEVRGYLFQGYNSPYYVVAAGYGIALKNEQNQIFDAEGGFLMRPAIGMRFGGGSGANIVADIGYQSQKATFSQRNLFNGEIEIRRFTYQRLSLRVGFVF